MRPGDDDLDPWSDTTPSVGEVRDDPFDDWPTDSAMGETAGPNSYEGLIARAAHLLIGVTPPGWAASSCCCSSCR